MTIGNQKIESVARELLEARPVGGLVEPPSQRFSGFSLEDGYAIGEEIYRLQKTKGVEMAGKKIGFTNQSIWPAMGLGHPIWARLYTETIKTQPELSLKNMASPKIEPEIVFRLSKDLAGKNLEAGQIMEAMEWIAFGYEVVDCNFPGWKFEAADAVADFGLHAALILGKPQPLANFKPEDLANFEVKLFQNEEIVALGAGRNVLGSPALAINWLLEALNKGGVETLKKGEIITTGTLTEALSILPGQDWRVEAAGLDLPPLGLKFTD